MSRASVAVLFPDNTIRYGIYDGTSDILQPRLFATSREPWDAYYGAVDMHPPSGYDASSAATVLIYCDYGGGSEWEGKATRDYVVSECDAMQIPIEAITDYDLDSEPSWVTWQAGADPSVRP